ncbi:nucleotidyltransferase family protein [Aphanothece sacrum]|uniref:DNA polymerase beta domain-containing protein region n=1 Tax=Aphanothece sacrum FPU1 TaxID=1920663 RepID=A0A401IJ82_APHSA|nr:nucleotidyltransferase family protein [Aphanothece sacrum]GBF81347.1 DNA polymerase beta domain-containing protein region [Aphanothece sacrum FPU1]GBF86131.1 DNA polymerase beta domain-containing protein [Aphanothece sacrum FPU3]
MKTLPIEISTTKITKFCQQWQITELSLFGSILREDFHDNSDIDILVTFFPKAQWSLLDFVRMEDQLETIFHCKVDLVMKQSIEQSDNWLRKQEILGTAQIIYAKR